MSAPLTALGVRPERVVRDGGDSSWPRGESGCLEGEWRWEWETEGCWLWIHRAAGSGYGKRRVARRPRHEATQIMRDGIEAASGAESPPLLNTSNECAPECEMQAADKRGPRAESPRFGWEGTWEV